MALTQPPQPPLLRHDYHLAESWGVPRVLEWLHSLNPALDAHTATWAAARIDGGALLRLDASRLEGELGVRSAVHRGVVLHHLQRLRGVVDEGKLVQRQWEMQQQQQQQSQRQQQQTLPQDDALAAPSAEAEIEAEAQQTQPLKFQPNPLDSADAAAANPSDASSGADAEPVAKDSAFSHTAAAAAAASAPVADPRATAELVAEEEEEERPVHLVVSPSTLSYPYSSTEPLRLTLRIRNPLPHGWSACWNLASSHPGVHRFVRHGCGGSSGGGDDASDGHAGADTDAEFGFGFLDPGQEALVDVLVDPVWLRSSAAAAASAPTGTSDYSFSEFLFSNLVDLDCFLLLQSVQPQPQQQQQGPVPAAAAAPALGGDEAAELWCVQRHAGSAAMLPPPWNDAPSAACAPVPSAALPGQGLGVNADRAGEPPSNFERLRAAWHAQRWPEIYPRSGAGAGAGAGADADAAVRRMRGQRSAQRAHAHIVDTFLCSLASSHRILLQAKAAPAGAGQRGPGEARAYWNAFSATAAAAAASSSPVPGVEAEEAASFFTYIPCLWSEGGLLEKQPPGPPPPGRRSLLPATAEQLRHGGGGSIGGGGGCVSAYWSSESCRTVASGPAGGYSHPIAGGAVETAAPFAHQAWPRGGQVARELVQQHPGFYTEWAGRKTRFEETTDMGGVLVAEPQQELQPQAQPPEPEPDSPVLRPRAAATAAAAPAPAVPSESVAPPSWRFFRLVVRLQVRFRRGRLAAATRLKRRLILSQLEQERALAAKVASASAAGGSKRSSATSSSSSSSSRRMTGAEFLQSQEARMQLALAKQVQEQQQLQEEHSSRDSQAGLDAVAPLVPAAEEGQRHLALQRFGADDGVDMATLWREAATASEAPPVSLATFRLVVGLQVRFRRLRRIAGAKLREKVLRSQLEEQLAMTARLRARREAPGGDGLGGLAVLRGSKRLSGAEWIAQQLASSAAAAAAEAASRSPAAPHTESEPSCTMEGGYMTETLDTITPADAGAPAPATAADADADAADAGVTGSDATSATDALGSAATPKRMKRVLWADGDGEHAEEQDGKQDDAATAVTMIYETHEAADSGFLVELLQSEDASPETAAPPSDPAPEPAPEHEHAPAPAVAPEALVVRDTVDQEMLRTDADMKSKLAEDEAARAARRARRLTGAEWARHQQQQDQQQSSVDDAASAAPAKEDTLRPASAGDIIPSAAASPEGAGALARRGTESKEALRAQLLEAQRTILALQAAQIQQLQRQQQQQQQAQAQIAQSVQESSPNTAQSPAAAEPEPRPQTPPRPVAGADAAEAAGGAASEQHAQEDEFVYHAVDAAGNEFVLQPVPLAMHVQQQQQQQQQHQQQQEQAFSPVHPSPYFFPSSPPPQPFRPSPPPRQQPSPSGSFESAQAGSPVFAALSPSPPAKQPRLVNIQRVDRSKLGANLSPSPRTARVQQSQSFGGSPEQHGQQGPFSPPYGHAHAASYDYSAAAAAAAAASAQLHQLPVHHPHYAQLAASMHAPPAFPQPPHFYGYYPPPYPYPYPPPPPPSHAQAHQYGSHAAYPFSPPYACYPYAPVPPPGPPPTATTASTAVDATATNPAPTPQIARDYDSAQQQQRNEVVQPPIQTPRKRATELTPQQQQQQQPSHAAEEASQEYDEFEVERAREYEHEPEPTESEHVDVSPPPPPPQQQQQRPQRPVSARPSPPQPPSSRPLPTQPPQLQQQPQQPSGPVSPQQPTQAQTPPPPQQQQPAFSPSQVQVQVQSPVASPRPSVPGPRPPTAPRPVFRPVLSPPAAAAPANNVHGSPASRDQGRDREAEVRTGTNSSPGEEFLRQKRTRHEFMRWTQTQAAAASVAADAQVASTSYCPAPQASGPGPVRLVASPRNPRPARDDPGQATDAALARAEEAAKALDALSQEEEEGEEYEQDFDVDAAGGAEGARRRGVVASPSALEAQYIRAATAQIRADKGGSVAEEKEHAGPAAQPSGSGPSSARSRSATAHFAAGAGSRLPTAAVAAGSHSHADPDVDLRSALYQPLVEERRRAEEDESGLPAYPPYRSSYYKQSSGGGFFASASPSSARKTARKVHSRK